MNATPAATVERIDFANGYRGITLGTVRLLIQYVREAEDHPRIRARLRSIFAGARSMDYDEELARVWRFVVDNVRYQMDPEGGEHITKPLEIDREIDEGTAAEDCESIALYAGTLLAGAGYDVQFEIQGRDPRRPEYFSHCALLVRHPVRNLWISFDPVGAFAFGEERFSLGSTMHRSGDPVQRFDLDGWSCPQGGPSTMATMFRTAFGDGAAIASGVLSTVGGFASYFGPYGQIVGGVAQVGSGIINAETGQQVASTSGSPAPIRGVPPGYPGGGPGRIKTLPGGTFLQTKPSDVGLVAQNKITPGSSASGASTALKVGAAAIIGGLVVRSLL